MAGTDIAGAASALIPKFSATTIYTIIFWGLLALVIMMIMGFGAWWYIDVLRYKRKIPIYADVAGRPTRVAIDRARVVKLGQGGEEVWYLKKRKQQIPPASIAMAKDEYWHYIKEDGDLINFGIENLNVIAKKAGIHFTNADMRYARSNIQRNLKDKYNKVTFMDKYGTVMIFTVHIIIVTVMFVWILKDFSKVAASLDSAIKNAADLVKAASIANGGGATGLVPAP